MAALIVLFFACCCYCETFFWHHSEAGGSNVIKGSDALYVMYMLACTHKISNWKLGDITVLMSVQKSFIGSSVNVHQHV